LMFKELQKLKKRDREDHVENNGFKEVLPEPERVKELEEVIMQIDQGAERF